MKIPEISIHHFMIIIYIDLEWYQVVMSFNDSAQRPQDLNFVALRLRFREFYCYPLLNKDGTSDTSQWLIEKKKYEPRVRHLQKIHRHKGYYIKKYYHKVEPEKYELDIDDGICEYYGRNIFAKQGEDDSLETHSNKDDELIEFVDRLEARIEKKKKLQAINLKHDPLSVE